MFRMKCLAILLVIGFFAAGAFGDEPKSYRINLAADFRVGGTDFQAGEYRLVVDAAKVRFIELKTDKAVELAAKVETVDNKFDATEIHSKNVNGVTQISEIRIRKTRIIFE